jgi:hypothetical protein
MTKTLASIIAEAEKQRTAAKQAEVLKNNSSKALKDIIGYAMDPNVTWLLPETDPPYTPMHPAADQEGRLYAETRRLIYFVDSPDGRQVKPLKREQLFIQLLESIDADDAKLLLRVKNKALKIKKEAVKIAFPGISGHW